MIRVIQDLTAVKPSAFVLYAADLVSSLYKIFICASYFIASTLVGFQFFFFNN